MARSSVTMFYIVCANVSVAFCKSLTSDQQDNSRNIQEPFELKIDLNSTEIPEENIDRTTWILLLILGIICCGLLCCIYTCIEVCFCRNKAKNCNNSVEKL